MLAIRGLALKNSGQSTEALHAFESAAATCPEFLPGLEGLAELQYAQHSPNAKETLQKILAIRPEDRTSHAMLAAIYARDGDCSAAIDHFSKAGDVIQSNPAAMTQYGSCLLSTGATGQAKSVFQSLLERQETPTNRLRYAYACWKANDYADGSRALDPLIAPSAPDPEALTLAARIYESAGHTPQAVDLLQKAIASRPDDPRNYLIFAEISFNHSSYKVGIDMLNAGLRRLPQEARLYVARGVLEVQQSSFDDALADFRNAHRLDPNLSLAGDAIGIMLDQRHQTTQSLAAFAVQAAAHPEDALVQYLYAEALSQSDQDGPGRNDAAAIEAARRAARLEPDYQPALDLLCKLELRAGNVSTALELAQRVLAKNPEDETAIYQAMLAYRRLGKKDEVNQLVARMKQVKEHQQDARTNYQLQEVANQTPGVTK